MSSQAYILALMWINIKGPEFEVWQHVWISKYKNSPPKCFTPNGSKEVFVIKRVKNTAP